MLRFALLVVFLLALPMVLYVTYARIRTGQTLDEVMNKVPIAPLTIAGAVLTAAVLLVYLQYNRNEPGGRYVPPVFKDGAIQPGHVE
jgi:ABC-type Fe3+ transport system permease subunit